LLQGLRAILKDGIGKALRDRGLWKVTIDLDANVIESHKREGYWAYLGEKGYQPVIAYWAEEDLIVADQFQDGNVPARMDLLPVLKDAISTLPTKHEMWSKTNSLIISINVVGGYIIERFMRGHTPVVLQRLKRR